MITSLASDGLLSAISISVYKEQMEMVKCIYYKTAQLYQANVVQQ